jgi:translation initiation factor 3 subunit D
MNPNEDVEDNFLLENLPGADEMLSKTLPNKDIMFYPFSQNQSLFLKAFDFISQKNINETEDFISIDTKSTSNIPKTKGNKNKKTLSQYNTNQNKKNTNKLNTFTPQLPRFKINQTINPEVSWKIIADFNKLILEKLVLSSDIKIKVEDKLMLGEIYQLQEDLDEKVSPMNPLPLNKYEHMKFFGNVTTLEDEIIKTGSNKGNIFITDKILSVIMTCVYSSHPWHLKITKLGDNIYIDKMDNSEIDLVTVNESDNTPYDDDDRNINSYRSLAIEATLINEFIKEQMLDFESEKFEDDGPNPFFDENYKNDNIEHLGYRYRLWTIDDMKILVRCQIHSFSPIDEESESRKNSESEEEEEEEEEKEEKSNFEFTNVYAMNEYDKNVYLSKEGNLTGALLKKELLNNHLKLTKWGVCSYLGGVSKIKIGFVTRKNVKENNEHLITGFYDIHTNDLLKITNFNKNIAWGIFKEIIDHIRRTKGDAYFILMKTLGSTTAKSMLKLYKVPEDYFKNLDEEE